MDYLLLKFIFITSIILQFLLFYHYVLVWRIFWNPGIKYASFVLENSLNSSILTPSFSSFTPFILRWFNLKIFIAPKYEGSSIVIFCLSKYFSKNIHTLLASVVIRIFSFLWKTLSLYILKQFFSLVHQYHY